MAEAEGKKQEKRHRGREKEKRRHGSLQKEGEGFADFPKRG